MTKSFDGKKIREEVLEELKTKIEAKGKKPGLAVFCIGDNPVCSKYVALKKKVADRIGVNFYDFAFDTSNSQAEIISKIEELNNDEKIDGIMIQMPIPDKFDKFEVVHSIAPEKDVDGLRFCCSYKSKFKPPVVLAILEAIRETYLTNYHSEYTKSRGEESQRSFVGSQDDTTIEQFNNLTIDQLLKSKKIVLIGEGFLVGGPLKSHFKEQGIQVQSINNINDSTVEQLRSADILISAVGKHDIITPLMVKEGVVLIDAGTTEVSGELRGDISPDCYPKSSYYTPVPGGIGPMTVAMLFRNLVE